MSFVIAAPAVVESAATDLASIGSNISAANVAAATQTTAVVAAGADEVSAAIAALFGSHAQAFQAVSAQAASFHQQFVQALNSGAASYASAEAANVSPMQRGAQRGECACRICTGAPADRQRRQWHLSQSERRGRRAVVRQRRQRLFFT